MFGLPYIFIIVANVKVTDKINKFNKGLAAWIWRNKSCEHGYSY